MKRKWFWSVLLLSGLCTAAFPAPPADFPEGIRLKPDGARLNGTVAEVLAPQPLPEGQERATTRNMTQQAKGTEVRGAALFLPVKITLDGPPSAALTPGEPVDCVIKTRNILGFSGF